MYAVSMCILCVSHDTDTGDTAISTNTNANVNIIISTGSRERENKEEKLTKVKRQEGPSGPVITNEGKATNPLE